MKMFWISTLILFLGSGCAVRKGEMEGQVKHVEQSNKYCLQIDTPNFKTVHKSELAEPATQICVDESMGTLSVQVGNSANCKRVADLTYSMTSSKDIPSFKRDFKIIGGQVGRSSLRMSNDNSVRYDVSLSADGRSGFLTVYEFVDQELFITNVTVAKPRGGGFNKSCSL